MKITDILTQKELDKCTKFYGNLDYDMLDYELLSNADKLSVSEYALMRIVAELSEISNKVDVLLEDR